MINRIINKIKTISRTKIIKYKYRNNILIKGKQRIPQDTNLIIEKGKINLGEQISIQSGVHLTAIDGGNLKIDDGCAINRNCIFISRNKICINKNVILGPNVCIYDHDHEFSYEGIEKNKFRIGSVIIEEGCWIGANVTILKNTHIGAFSIIGAGTVVGGVEIPPHSMVVANRLLNIQEIRRKEISGAM